MCGIVGFAGQSQACEFLLDGLSRLEYRGYDSAGIALLDKTEIRVEKTTDKIEGLKAQVRDTARGSIGIGHTRWATHGEPSLANAHPHLSGDKSFAVVHNGIIENYAELKSELISDGVSFSSDTDTEVIPHLLQKYYEGDLLDAVFKTIKRLEGSYALCILCAHHPEKIVAVKKFSPLIIGAGEGENYIASDISALVSKTRNVVYMNDGEVALIAKDSIKLYSAEKVLLTPEISHIDWSVNAAEKQDFDHFMLKEIYEQPEAVARTISAYMDGDEIKFNKFEINGNINRIIIIGCGSAYHAGVVGGYVFEQLIRIPTKIELASEFRYRNPIVDDKALVIAISQSGETADTLAALNEAKRRGAQTVAIVNVVGSSIGKAAHSVIYTLAGPEISVATTKGYSTQLCALYALAIHLAERFGTTSDTTLTAAKAALRQLPDIIDEALGNQDKIRKIAKKCASAQSVFFIGRNIDYAVALEASLKLKEISYIHSETQAAGELKHGTISLIEKGTLVFALCGNDSLYGKMLSNIREVTARGAWVAACAVAGKTAIENETDCAFYMPQCHELFKASIEIIPFQLLAYFTAKERGCDIDKPRNLAKSVTVE